MDKNKEDKFVGSMVGGVNAGCPAYVGITWNEEGKVLELLTQHRRYSITRLRAKMIDEKGSLHVFDEHSKDFVCVFRKGSSEKPKKNAILLINEAGEYLLSSKDGFLEATVYVQAIPIVTREEGQPDPIALWARFQKQADADADVKNRVVAITSDFNLVWLLDAFADSIQDGKEGEGNVSL